MRYLLLACLLLSLAGCVQKNGVKNASAARSLQSSLINYNDPLRGIHLEYPADWTEQGVPASGQVLLILQLPDAAKPAGLPPTIQISAQQQGGKLELAQIEHAVVERGQNSLTDFKVLGNVPSSLGGEPARQIIYQGTSSGIAVQTMTLIALHRGQGFAISFAADPSEFESRLSAVQRVLGSFSFTR